MTSIRRILVTPDQATEWLRGHDEPVDPDALARHLVRLLTDEMEPGPPIEIRDGTVVNGAHRLTAIVMVRFLDGFEGRELDVVFSDD